MAHGNTCAVVWQSKTIPMRTHRPPRVACVARQGPHAGKCVCAHRGNGRGAEPLARAHYMICVRNYAIAMSARAHTRARTYTHKRVANTPHDTQCNAKRCNELAGRTAARSECHMMWAHKRWQLSGLLQDLICSCETATASVGHHSNAAYAYEPIHHTQWRHCWSCDCRATTRNQCRRQHNVWLYTDTRTHATITRYPHRQQSPTVCHTTDVPLKRAAGVVMRLSWVRRTSCWRRMAKFAAAVLWWH